MCSPWRWRCWAEDSPRPGPPPPPRSSSHTRRGSHSPAECWYFTDMSQLLNSPEDSLGPEHGDYCPSCCYRRRCPPFVMGMGTVLRWYWCHDDGHLVSLAACLARECEVWSVSFPQPPRSSVSMLGQFRAKISRAWSPTFWREQIMNPESGVYQ